MRHVWVIRISQGAHHQGNACAPFTRPIVREVDSSHVLGSHNIAATHHIIMSGTKAPQPHTDLYVKLAAAVLQERCSSNSDLDDMQLVTRFHSSRIPGITMPDYFKRIAKYSFCSAECHIIALIYIDRFCAAKQLPLTFRSIHRLVITCVMIAAKLRDDIYYSNDYYASIGGVSNRELNELEVDMLSAIDWKTHVRSEEFNRYVCALMDRFSMLVDPALAATAKLTPVPSPTTCAVQTA